MGPFIKPVRLVLVELSRDDQRELVLELTRDYFRWMDGEMERAIGLPLSAVVGMDVEIQVKLEQLSGARLQRCEHLAIPLREDVVSCVFRSGEHGLREGRGWVVGRWHRKGG